MYFNLPAAAERGARQSIQSPPMSPTATRLCALHELEDPGSAVFPLPGHGNRQIMVIRQGEEVFGYLNNCPHTGGPLDWVPGVFLDIDKKYIQCATHDALFRIADGECVYGPCPGQRLQAVAVYCIDGWVCYRDGRSRITRADRPASPCRGRRIPETRD